MSGFTNYLEDALIDHLVGHATFTPPELHCALFTSAPTDTAEGTEVVGGSYARQQVEQWTDAVNGVVSNDLAIVFDNLPACTVTHFGFFDSATAGILLMFGAVNSPIVITAGMDLTFNPGDIDLQVT